MTIVTPAVILMVSKRRKKQKRPRPTPHVCLNEVRRLVQNGQVLIRPNALWDAEEAFGWDEADIFDALGRLKPKHFYKSAESDCVPGTMLDFYKARSLKGENVYIHFYVDEETRKLVVNSFKEDKEKQ
ncbi:MAG: type II toxin-antitoxin system MqsR family toxin [Candidatus Eisenbacteria sp.]|nr:type II toxin-antitoxin system MqsR family toxin [Candidatus Eisenbacteria bacterium]